MLSRLSIRDIVLIERLDIDYAAGLSVLTGETGAGKSILLDAFALALGSRGDASLVRNGAEQGQVTAAFDVAADHPALAMLAENGIARRGRPDPAPRAARGRAHPRLRQRPAGERAGAQGARRRAGRDPRPARRPRAGRHGGTPPPARCLCGPGRRCRGRVGGCGPRAAPPRRRSRAHRARVEQARREADYLRHAVEELTRLKPEAGEETALAEKRATMMQVDKVAEDLRDAHEAVAGERSPIAALSAALRRLERRRAQAPALIDPPVKALDAALTALDDARGASRCRAARREPRSARARPDRGAAVRAARGRRASTMSRSTILRRWRRATPPISRRIDAGAEELEDARSGGARGGGSLRQGRRRAFGRAAEGRRQARQGGDGGAQAPEARARALLHQHRAATRPGPTASTASSSGSRPIRARGRVR